MLLQSLHTHSLYDDGQDTLARMAQNAEAAGLDALGFSGHSPLPFANDWAIDQSCLADYLREARSLQADFRGRFSLYCGLEWDSCSPLPEQKLDYLIGSIHYFPALPDGTRFTVDGSAQLLAQCAQVQFGGDMAAQARRSISSAILTSSRSSMSRTRAIPSSRPAHAPRWSG